MKVLVIGSGGREHAIAWRLAQSPRVQKVFVAPGNAGTATEPGVENLAITDLEALADFAQREPIGLTVVGPEAPLAAGVVDLFQSRGLRIFGPSRACAQLEASKEFAKNFMQRHNIPTAEFASFTDPRAAHEYVAARGAPIVIKADGLAAGKGVVVAMDEADAHAAIDAMLVGGSMGEAGHRVVIEEFLEGEEASFIVMCDGSHVLTLATSQDHKRLQDGDIGPNTGGMGAYVDERLLSKESTQTIMETVMRPAIDGMRKEGSPFTGFLYAGLMMTGDGPKTLEFNVRMGDPETQPILYRLQSDLAQILYAGATGNLHAQTLEWTTDPAVAIVFAAAGYPGKPRTGDVISGIAKAESSGAKVFQAGTARGQQGDLLTNGGRVLAVTASAKSLPEAILSAYEAAAAINYTGMQFRKDIGHKGLKRW